MSNKVITTLLARDRKFYIIHFKGYYCAIEDKYLDEDMKLTQQLNGLQMHAMKDMPQCIKSVQDAVEIDYLMSLGMSFEDAFNQRFRVSAK